MYRIRQLLLLIGDLAALYLGLYLALIIRYQRTPGEELIKLLPSMGGLFLIALIISFITGLYDLTRAKNSWRFFQRVAISAIVWMLAGVLYFYINPGNYLTPKTILALTALCGFGLIAIWRYFHNKFLSNIILKTNVVFVGITAETIELIKNINNNPQIGYQTIGIVDTEKNILPEELKNIPVTTNLGELKNITKQSIQIIVIAPHLVKNNNILKELYTYLSKQTEMVDLAKFYEDIMGRIPPFTFSESWFLTNLHEQQKKIYDRFRILIDYILGILLAIFFVITFPFVTIAIKITSRGPLFFIQERIGRNGKPFNMYKYRTMMKLNANGSAETDGPQFAEKKDRRITAIGRILRRTRIDEVPQFINILKGEMSVIGPRPERPEFVKQLTEAMPFYALRHLVKPGLTGWAQLKSGYYGTIEENLRKLEYDLYYIKNRGPLLDAIILLRTINVVVRMIGR